MKQLTRSNLTATLRDKHYRLTLQMRKPQHTAVKSVARGELLEELD